LPSSSSASAAPLHLILERSRALLTFIQVTHGLALLTALATPVPWWLRLGLAIAVLISLRWALHNSQRVQGLTLTAGGDWEILYRGHSRQARPAPGSVVTPWIVLLNLSEEGRRIDIPICRDGVDPESFRRLRVQLRISGPADEGG
jgi:hypothetical protein